MQRIKKPKREDRIDVGRLRQTENKHQFRKYVEEQEITGENTWVDLKQRLTKAANNCRPKKKRNKRNNWMTDETIELLNQRRNENDQRAVKELTKTIRRRCREAKDEEIEQKCREVEDLENGNETMKMYQLVRQLAPKKKPKQKKSNSR